MCIRDRLYTGSENQPFSFPEMDDTTSFTAIGDGVVEANDTNGSSMLYNSSMYAEPECDYSVVTDADGNAWYQMSGTDIPPQFTGDNGVSFSSMPEGTEFSQNGSGVIEAS